MQPVQQDRYEGIIPSLAVEFDVYSNGGAPYSDPGDNYISIHRNGNAGSAGIVPGGNNVLATMQNNQWHDVEIDWNPATTTFKVIYDGVTTHSILRDIVANDLNSSSQAYIGFTASTGGLTNTFAVCSGAISGTVLSTPCAGNNTFNLYGNANNNVAGYIQLTPNTSNQSGQAWSKNKITLASNFSQKFRAFFGSSDGGGADGLTFLFRGPGAPVVGISGEGVGYGGISPSFGIEFDTYQNITASNPGSPYIGAPINDPANDHIAYHVNGNYTQGGRIGNNVDVGNIEDNTWHDVEVKWNATTHVLETYLDGVLRNTITRDIVALDFNNNPVVSFGFTASTGGSTNEHAVCIQEIIATVPAELTKSVSPTTINNGGVAAYTWSVANTGQGATAQSNISFTDTLPASLKVAAAPDIVFSGWSVNPVVTAVAGSSSVIVSGGAVAAGAIATIMVNITNATGMSGNCPDPNFTNAAINITGISNNLTNNVGAGPCLNVLPTPACKAGTVAPVVH
jgi:uncharacterized repeat protein (TIGR01451 family)